MPLTAQDMEAISTLIQGTVQAVLAAQRSETAAGPTAKSERIDERYYRKIQQFTGDNWKDWCFQFKSATRGSSNIAYNLLNWAEKEVAKIEDYTEFEGDEAQAEKLSNEIFNVITTMVQGEALQLLHNCDYNGAEAWRRLSKRYSPSTPLRAMQLMLQVVNPGKAKNLKEIPGIVDRWETRVLALQRDFKETVGSRMKAAILISMLPTDIQDALIQQADKYEEYQPTKEKILSIVDAKMAMRSPDEMDVDAVTGQGKLQHEEGGGDEEIDAVGKGGIYCYRCGGQGHIAAKCGTPEPIKGKGKGGKGGHDGKGAKGGGKGGKGGKGDWSGFCSYCGKRGHGPKNCWTKEKDEANGTTKNDMGAIEDEASEQYSLDHELGGFDMACIDKADDECMPELVDSSSEDEAEVEEVESEESEKELNEEETTEVIERLLRKMTIQQRRKGEKRQPKKQSKKEIYGMECCRKRTIGKGKITVDSGAAESVIPKDLLKEIPTQESEGSRNGVQYIAANGGKMPNLGEKKVHFKTKDGMESNVVFQVTHARKPLASVSKIVKKGNRVVFEPGKAYIQNIPSGKRIELEEANGTYHMYVEYLMEDAGFTRLGQ